jgi:beta-galactosidase
LSTSRQRTAALAAALLRWAGPDRADWAGLPASVTCTGATAAGGRRLRFLHNWSWAPSTVSAPVECRDALTDKPIPAAGDIDLGPWDVRVLVEGLR